MHQGHRSLAETARMHHRIISKHIARAELVYNRSGVRFYIATIIEHRDTGVEEAFLRSVFTADQNVTLIAQIHQIRQLREFAKVCQRNGDFQQSLHITVDISGLLGSVEDQMGNLDFETSSLGVADKDWLLEHLTEAEKCTVLNDARFREWVLNLPEIQHGLELGILENEDQAVRSVLEIEDIIPFHDSENVDNSHDEHAPR